MTGPSEAPPRESLQHLQLLVENLDLVFWFRDLVEERVIDISPAFEKAWGRSRESLMAAPYVWVKALHPDDGERVLSKAINEGRQAPDYIESRIVRSDGMVRKIRDRALQVRNAGGAVTRLVGVAEDVTARP
ncbi:MAG TPA: PAS domain-containing protein [Planctomycetota bacterium]|nr:PAS domain-containing protein [Planctomycetota bacterium]